MFRLKIKSTHRNQIHYNVQIEFTSRLLNFAKIAITNAILVRVQGQEIAQLAKMPKMDHTVSHLAQWESSTIAENVLRVTRIVSTVVQDQRTISDQAVAALAIKLLLKATAKWLV